MSGLPEPPFVLLADDDQARLADLRNALRLAGAHVAACPSVRVALEGITFHVPSTVVVRPAMQDGRGWEVVYAARAQGAIPTVVLDDASNPSVRRTAFAAGADDVLTADDPAELATRVLALASRARHPSGDGAVFRHRGLVMDVAAHMVRLHGRTIDLTAQQFAILRALLEANGATLDRDRLVSSIESLDEEPPSERAIDLHITRLRRRLGDDAHHPRYIEAVYGVGYRLAVADAAPTGIGEEAEGVLLSLPDPLLVIDGKRRVRFANDAAVRFLARERDEIVGQTCADLLGCLDPAGGALDGPRCYARVVGAGGTTLRGAPAQIRCGGERTAVELTYSRVQTDGLLTISIHPRSGDGPGR